MHPLKHIKKRPGKRLKPHNYRKIGAILRSLNLICLWLRQMAIFTASGSNPKPFANPINKQYTHNGEEDPSCIYSNGWTRLTPTLKTWQGIT